MTDTNLDHSSEFSRQYPDAVPEEELDAFRYAWIQEIHAAESVLALTDEDVLQAHLAYQPPVVVPRLPVVAQSHQSHQPSFHAPVADPRAHRAFPLTAQDLWGDPDSTGPASVVLLDDDHVCRICLSVKSHPVACVVLSI
jgi:hypothetical protein